MRQRSLDARDRKILEVLAGDAWVTYRALGEKINLSPSAAQRRVERLRKEGAIEGAVARINPQALDRPLRIFVMIELVRDAGASLRAFAKALRRYPDVVEAHFVAGSIDILMVVQATSMATYADFAERHLNDNPKIKRYSTLTVLKSLI